MRIAIAVCATLALALRLPGIFQDPWIDEVWSWGSARSAASAWEALSARGSNNHPLNSLWIRLLGDRDAFWPYRLVSLAAGAGTVLLAARIGARAGRASAVLAAFLAAVCYPLVVYSTEARGYALQVFATLLAYECAWTWLERRSAGALVTFWIASIAGFLAQYLYAVGWLAIAAGVVAAVLGPQDAARPRTSLRDAAWLLAPPAIAFAAWWLAVARGLVNQGAPPWSAREVAAQTLAWSTGVPDAVWGIGAVLVAVVLALDARRLRARGDASWIVQVLGVAVLPIAGAFLLRGDYVAPRYFLAALALWLLSAARVLAGLAARGRAGTAAVAAIVALFALGHALRCERFLRVGRGTPGAIVAEMARRSGEPAIRVAGNYDFNVGGMLAWLGRELPPGRSIQYVSGRSLPAAGVPFLIVDRPRFESEPEPSLTIAGLGFVRIAVSRHDGPCGSDWALYQLR